MSMSTNEGNVTRVTVELILTRASREDTGVYECSVANLLNIVTRNISLIVQCTFEFGRPFYINSNYIPMIIINLCTHNYTINWQKVIIVLIFILLNYYCKYVCRGYS